MNITLQTIQRLCRALALLPLLLSSARGQVAQQGAKSPGVALFEARRYDDAKRDFALRIQRNANDREAMYYLGRVAAAQSATDESVKWFEKAVEADPQNADYHYWLGNAYGDAAQHASKFRQPFLARKVKAEFERAVQLDPRQLEGRLGLIEFYVQAPGFMGGSIPKAKEQAAEIMKLNRMRGGLAIASIAEREKNLVDAERGYRVAYDAAPDSLPAFASLTNFLLRQSRAEELFALAERYEKTHPDEQWGQLVYGRAAAATGRNMERGERLLRAFIASPPKEASPQQLSGAHYRLGMILERTARRELAKGEYQVAIKLNDRNEDAKKALEKVMQ
ncbi:MAG: Tetratricopeptide repeat-containing protein [Gemmatimonadetes bacterium]|nr:Tetratricopeptide repeat-containing protein [Gemmatimonadota bacterium]